MDINEFINLPAAQVAGIVRTAGPKVCAIPINGTRRWFLLEHPPETWHGKGFLEAFHELSVARQLDLYRMFFDHGIHTLVMPLFGPDQMDHGPEYQEEIIGALVELASAPQFLDFYREHDVRVRFYGDYRRYLSGTLYASACNTFDRVAELTSGHSRCRLLYGLFAHDPAERIAEVSLEYYLQKGKLPDKRSIVELYYGEYIPPADLFIGFDRFSEYDIPLLASGTEDLYFTASPSFYMNDRQLREILYDHLFVRTAKEQDYTTLSPQAVERMRDFYRENQGSTFGVGVVRDGFWYPLPGCVIPSSFKM